MRNINKKTAMRDSGFYPAISSSGYISAGIGTTFIVERLPWLHRASPSTTLDKINNYRYPYSEPVSIKKYQKV